MPIRVPIACRLTHVRAPGLPEDHAQMLEGLRKAGLLED
jgi:hypothetical protein